MYFARSPYTDPFTLNSTKTFHSATVELSRGDVPTLPMVLPLYKVIEATLEQGKKAAARGGAEMIICEEAFDAALVKLAKYTSIACSSELHLLAVGMSNSCTKQI